MVADNAGNHFIHLIGKGRVEQLGDRCMRWIHAQYALIFTALALESLRRLARRHAPSTVVLLPVSLILVYENAVLAVGGWIGAGQRLRALSYPRFVLHAVGTPLFVISAVDLAHRAGMPGMRRPQAQIPTLLTVLALISYGVYELHELDLEPLEFAGVVRYGPKVAQSPVVGIVPTLALLGAGIVVWRRRGSPWLALAALLLIVGSGAAFRLGRAPFSMISNTLELVLLAAVADCERRLHDDPGGEAV
jgi:hypothetical protein